MGNQGRNIKRLATKVIVAALVFCAEPCLAEELGARAANRQLAGELSQRLIEIGELNLAQSVIDEHLRIDPTDASSWATLSFVFTEKRDYAKAAETLTKAEYNTNSSSAATIAYQKAYLAAATGKKDEAEKIFLSLAANGGATAAKADAAVKAIRKGSPPPKLVTRQVFKKEIEPPSSPASPQVATSKTQSAEEPLQVSFVTAGGAGMRVGYDTNVLQIPDKLVPQFSGKESFFTGASAQGMGAAAVGRHVFSLTTVLAATAHENQLAKTLNNILLNIGAQVRPDIAPLSPLQISLGAYSTTLWMNPNGYRLFQRSSSLKPTVSYSNGDSLDFTLGVSLAKSSYPGVEIASPADDRSGITRGLDLSGRKSFGSWSLGASFNLALLDAVGDNFDNVGQIYGISTVVPFSGAKISEWSATATLTKSSFANNVEGRTDRIVGISSTAVVPLDNWFKGMTGSFVYDFTRSSSTSADVSFSKHVFSVAINYAPQK